MKQLATTACLACVIGLGACGGGGSGEASTAPAANPPAAAAPADPVRPALPSAGTPLLPHALPVVVDRGPDLFLLTGRKVVNTLYASITLCTPGSASACETIDHLVVDTGSVGLRVLASALTGATAFAPVIEPVGGSPLRECVQFADGYSWGSVVTADVQIGGRTLASLPVNVIGDSAAGSAPGSCVSGPAKNTLTAFGANGVLGVGSFLRDCGPDCAGNALAGWYYVCPSAGTGSLCRPTVVPLEQQVANPVAALASDNNGVTIELPAIPQSGSASANGTLYFGVATHPHNELRGARLFTLDRFGTLLTEHGTRTHRAIVDSGANGFVFASDSLATCERNRSFYCPMAGGAATSAPQTAAIVGRNGQRETVAFTVDNIDQLFTGQAALPGLAAPASGMIGGAASLFAWGLPFFFGRTVHVLFEGSTVGDTSGPAIGF